MKEVLLVPSTLLLDSVWKVRIFDPKKTVITLSFDNIDAVHSCCVKRFCPQELKIKILSNFGRHLS